MDCHMVTWQLINDENPRIVGHMKNKLIMKIVSFLFSGHLTTANVFIENGKARISAIENFILGVPSFYR